jgi:hypothetical protein
MEVGQGPNWGCSAKEKKNLECTNKLHWKSIVPDFTKVGLVKIFISFDTIPCSPLKINRRFGGACRLHIQSRRMSRERNQREAGSKHSSRTVLWPLHVDTRRG